MSRPGGVLPTVMRRCVRSRKLVNEPPGSCRAKTQQTQPYYENSNKFCFLAPSDSQLIFCHLALFMSVFIFKQAKL